MKLSDKCLVLAASLLVLLNAAAIGGEELISKQLQDKGVTATPANGGGIAVSIKECSKLDAADFQAIGKLEHIKSLSFGLGLNEASFALFTDLSELESLSSNGMQLSDDGLKPLEQSKKLKSVAFFHPGALFTGAGLSHLAELKSLERLTVAGSDKFGDTGMAAVGKLTQLKEFRTWHSGVTIEGVKALAALKDLKSINLGQRLSYKPPVSVSNETVGVLAEMKSLESIQLSEARLSLKALSQLKQLPALKKLTLDGIELPKADLDTLAKELPNVAIKYTEPSEAYTKRIRQLFGAE